MHWLDPTGSRDELGLRTQGHERGYCESVAKGMLDAYKTKI
ncbi:hypothetical protein ABN276_12075 [Providencia huaxiensis]